MMVGRAQGRGRGNWCLMGIEFQFGKTKKVLHMDSGDGCHNSVNVLNASALYTYKELRW